MGFEDVVDSEGFVFAHHNDRDMDSFERFRRRAQDRYVRNQQNRRVREIDNNVKLWDRMIRRKVCPVDVDRLGSFFVVNDEDRAYSIVREFIARGWVCPSEVKIMSQEALLSLLSLGFAAANEFKDIFSHRVFLIDQITERAYSDRELMVWNRLVDRTRFGDQHVVFSGECSLENFSDRLMNPCRHVTECSSNVTKSDDISEKLGLFS